MTDRLRSTARLLPKAQSFAVKAGSFVGGVAILRHEIFQATTAEPLLVFLGLWLCGIAPATFFDGLRRLTRSVEEGAIPDELPADDSSSDRRRR